LFSMSDSHLGCTSRVATHWNDNKKIPDFSLAVNNFQ